MVREAAEVYSHLLLLIINLVSTYTQEKKKKRKEKRDQQAVVVCEQDQVLLEELSWVRLSSVVSSSASSASDGVPSGCEECSMEEAVLVYLLSYQYSLSVCISLT